MKAQLFLVIALFSLSASAQQRHVVLMGSGTGIFATNSFTVESYERAELVSFPWSGFEHHPSSTWIEVRCAGNVTRYKRYVPADPFDPLIVPGPATISLVNAYDQPMATFRVLPDAYPVGRSSLVPPGPGASVALQWSTNLVDWSSTTNGLYTNLPVATFFRISVEAVK